MAQKPPRENPSRSAVRRLIAAGASPQRANQFAQQTMAKAVPEMPRVDRAIRGGAPRITQPVMPEVAPMAMPEVVPAVMPEVSPQTMPQAMPEVASEGMVSAMSAPQIGKPQGPNEWYNEKLGELSFKVAPFQYRPPKVTDAGFNQYYDLVLGAGSYANAFDSVLAQTADLATKAPILAGAQTTGDLFAKSVLGSIKKGLSEQQVLQLVKQSPISSKVYKNTDAQLKAVKQMYAEYNQNIVKPLQAVLKSTANENMDYKYSLPSDKLKWGATTDLSKGIVGWNQSAALKQIYDANAKNPKFNKAKHETKLVTAILDWATKNNWTPYREETKRRDSLKGKTLP